MHKILLVNFKNTFLIVLTCLFSLGSCQSQKNEQPKKTSLPEKNLNTSIIVGANQTGKYLPLLKDRNIGIVANQTSVIFKNTGFTHLVDSLHALNIKIKRVFAPEHGFRGKADAGEHIANGKDAKTGIDIISIYGKNKKPTNEQLKGLDIIIFDIQDVGARFYTYISSLHYIMEACAENNIPLLVLDRPNPNGHYIDGPVLEPKHKSFVGMHPIPVVHGMTIGEYAQMINGEKWLNNNIKCELHIISCKNYTKDKPYSLPIKPSPNLPNDAAINLYPSLCFFEGTSVSVGRGTEQQFQLFGAPFLNKTDFTFTPQPNEGAKYPKHENKICYGYDLSQQQPLHKLNLNWLIQAYNESANSDVTFWNNFFTKLAGTEQLQQQITNGDSEKDIRASWQEGLQKYNTMRSAYLLY
ncbi:MAG: exo-beta-N-acetylmuramidase NamZ family protein [Flavobacteriaceae bacterium]